MTPEQYELLAALVGGAFTTLLAVIGGPRAVRAGLKWIAGYKERRAKAREDLALKKLSADESTIRQLFARLDAQDEVIAAQARQIASQEQRLTELLARADELRARAERAEAEVGRLRERLERYERRSISPLPQPVHLPPPALVRSRRPKLDDGEE